MEVKQFFFYHGDHDEKFIIYIIKNDKILHLVNIEAEVKAFPFAANETMTKRDSGEKGINQLTLRS